MSSALLALGLLGIAGWFLLLARGPTPSSRLSVLVEAVSAETVIATLIAVVLVSFGAFRPAATLALAAALPFGILAKLDRMRVRPLPEGPWLSPPDWLALLVLMLMAPIVLPRMEQLRMDSDAGVYSNRAIHHLRTGQLRGSIPVRDRLEGELLSIFDRDNMVEGRRDGAGTRYYLLGTYVPSSDHARFHFQFFPGWPMVMALWAGIFGVPQASAALAFLYALSVLLFSLVLERLTECAAARAMTVTIFASSPLVVFFSKYTTSEALLLFLFLFVLHFLGRSSRWRAALAAVGVLLLAVSHCSTFLYAPLLLLPLLEAYRSADRRLALFSFLAFAALLAGLPLGHFFSRFYLRDIYSISFRSLPVNDPATAGIAVVAAFYSAGCVLSLTLLARPLRASGRLAALAAGAERLLAVVVFPALALAATWTAWRGHQLGWTHRFTQSLPDGAWSARLHYAGQGWPALAHLDIVSMVMATSLVGLPTVLALAVVRGREASASAARAFLLTAMLWTLAIFTFFHVDTPFNYYASRYFLPVLVPTTLLLLGSLLGLFRPPRAWLALVGLVALAFNLYFDRGLYRYPSESEKLMFVEEVARRTGSNRVLFVQAEESTFRLLALLLRSLHGISVVRVAHVAGRPEMAIIGRYAAELSLTDAAVLSTLAPAEGRAFAELSLLERYFSQQGVIYPTDYAEHRRTYYLYDLDFAGDATGQAPSAPTL